MSVEQVTEHVYRIPQGDVNFFLIVGPTGLALIDSGFPGSLPVLEEALATLGHGPEEITDIVVTHCHPDHAGGVAEIKAATGARLWMHAADAALVRAGRCFRPWQAAPGPEKAARVQEHISLAPEHIGAAEVEGEARPGEAIPVAGGIEVIGTPGHTVGHSVFLWGGDGGVLFLGDAAEHREDLDSATIYEDYEEGMQSLRALADLDFEVACFAHGAPIVGGASQEFRRVWRSGRG